MSKGSAVLHDRDDPIRGRRPGRVVPAHRSARPGGRVLLSGHLRTAAGQLASPRGLSLLVAVLLPTIILGWVAMRTPVSFDGAMNLQAVSHFIEHGQYARSYYWVSNSVPAGATAGGPRLFPQEVQTNGPFILIASLGIGLFGHGQFGFQFANLFFIALASGVIWFTLRRWPVIAAVAPAAILLALPDAFSNELGGIGEIPAISLMLVAFVLLAEAARARTERAVVAYLSAAWFTAGLAVDTKTYLIGAGPAIVVGVVAVRAMRPIRWRTLVTSALWFLVAPVLYEVFRLVELGSVHAYLSWWRAQKAAVAQESGLQGQSKGLLATVRFQLGALLRTAGADRLALIAVTLLIAAAAVFGVGLLLQRRSEGRLAASPIAVLAACLTTMALTYAAWWSAYLPVDKEFSRRSYPILVPLGLLLVLLLCVSASRLRSSLVTGRRRPIARSQVIWSGGLAALSLVLVLLDAAPVPGRVRAQFDSPASLPAYSAAAAVVDHAPRSYRFYGDGWGSSPIVSLMSGRDFYNLQYTPPCSVSPSRDVIVWDGIDISESRSPTPADPRFVYTLYARTPAASFYRMSPTPGQHCAS